MKKLISLAIIVLSLPLWGEQRFESIRSVGAREGLANVTINALWQDETGMMWIGTQDGLCRYDGVNMEIFRPVQGDTTSIYSNNIKEICGDRNGNIWVISKFALSSYSLDTRKFRTILKSEVQSITYGLDCLWIATSNSLYRLRGQNLEKLSTTEPETRYTCIYCSPTGQLLAGTTTGLVWVDKNGKTSSIFDGDHVLSIFEDSRKNIWVGTRTKGVFCISPSGQTSYINAEKNGLSSNYVRTICEDSYGGYWIGTFEGTDVFDINHKLVSRVTGVSTNCILRDSQNSIWVGARRGVNLYNQERNIFTRHDEVLSGSPYEAISTILASDDGKSLFIGTERSGLFVKNLLSGSFFGVRGLSSNAIYSLYQDSDGMLWVGTRFGGLDKVNLKTGRVEVYKTTENVYKILPLGGNQILFSTNKGLYSINRDGSGLCQLEISERVDGRYVQDFTVDGKGQCWVSVSEGVVCFDPASGDKREYFFEDKSVLGPSRVLASCVDSKGNLWFCTSGSGLLRYDYDSDAWTSYRTENSRIPSNYINSMAESPSGYLMLATNDGFSKFDMENSIFHNFSIGAGFPVSGVLVNGMTVGGDGTIFVSNHRELVSFRETRLENPFRPSSLFISSFSVEGEEYLGKSSDMTFIIPSGKDVIEITASMPDFLSNAPLEYSFNSGKMWMPMQENRKIVCAGYSAGLYSITVRPEGSKDPSSAVTLRFYIRRPWYASILALIIYALMAVVLATYLIRKTWKRKSEILLAQNQVQVQQPSDFVQKITAIVKENISNTEIDVDFLSAEMALGRTNLFAKVKEETGMTPGKFILSVRMDAAVRMLEENSEDSIAEIAYSTGFNSPNYFTRAFKNTYGMTPSEYRAKNQRK